jgi:hypothetical protein
MNTTEYKLLNVNGDGSCFYRSLYNCLKHGNSLESAISHFNHLNEEVSNSVIDENEFVRLVRYTLSYLIRSGKDYKIIKSVYNNFESYDKETFKEVLKSFPAWFNREFLLIKDYGEKIMTNKIFRRIISESVKENNNWVSEIEIEIIKNVFLEIGLCVMIINNSVKENFIFNSKTLYVMNIREYHYVSILPKFIKTDLDDGIQFEEFKNDKTKVKTTDKTKVKKVEKLNKPVVTPIVTTVVTHVVTPIVTPVTPPRKILNPATGRYVLANGKIGKKILESQNN